VMIAMALACEPKLLIADEPTTALDVTIQKQILELIDDLRERLAMSVILVTHDLGVIAGRADRVAVMYAGKVVETTTTQALFAGPRHPYTEALFQALPEKAVESRERLYSIPGTPPDLIHPPAGCRFASRCRYVQDKCLSEEPPLLANPSTHGYACFFPVALAHSGPKRADEAVIATPDALTEPADVPETAPATAPAATPAPSANLSDANSTPIGAVKSAIDREASAAVSGPDESAPVVLATRHLVKEFPVTRGLLQRKIGAVSAVADVSFEIRRGETFGLVGESGCGKSTIGRLIARMERPTGGSISFEGTDLAKVGGRVGRQLGRKVQYMFQDSYSAMNPRMRAGAILREPLIVQGLGSRAEQHQRVAEMLDHVGLPRNAVERYPHEFSGGQRQRLGFARALILNPDLIVADEPVSALDVSIQAQILNLMRDLQRELGLTYLFISHDLAVVRYLSNHIGVMYLGKLVEVGPADEVYLTPAHPYTQGLIDSAPVPDPGAERASADSGVRGELPSAIHPPSGCRFRTRCPLVQDICAQDEPPLRAFSAAGHQAACHFPLRQPLATLAPSPLPLPAEQPQ
jgi:peptide/nickel transport system ATP-binding protein